jgi:hypothetical protein
MVCQIDGGTWAESVWEQDAEEDFGPDTEAGSHMRLE